MDTASEHQHPDDSRDLLRREREFESELTSIDRRYAALFAQIDPDRSLDWLMPDATPERKLRALARILPEKAMIESALTELRDSWKMEVRGFHRTLQERFGFDAVEAGRRVRQLAASRSILAKKDDSCWKLLERLGCRSRLGDRTPDELACANVTDSPKRDAPEMPSRTEQILDGSNRIPERDHLLRSYKLEHPKVSNEKIAQAAEMHPTEFYRWFHGTSRAEPTKQQRLEDLLRSMKSPKDWKQDSAAM